ncbi:MAG: beta-lactamase family protein [Clostridiales bacterium]|nr:beta-lactamase family protein [Clostridiales bacterium]
MNLIKHVLTLIALFSLVALMCEPILAATLPSGIPDEKLEQTIDNFVEEHIGTTAAISISVFDRDIIHFQKSYGYLNIEEKVENNSDAVFEWGSITKLFVWVTVMQLVEDGKIDLNEDIRTYLPEGFLRKLKYDDPITISHLMNHSAGWQEVQIGMTVPEGGEVKELGDSLKILEPVQVFRPGEYTAYSNYGAALAGYIVERISGKPFYEIAHERIFDPLEMKHTAIKPDLSDNQWVKERRRLLIGYTTDLHGLGSQPFITPLYPCGQTVGTISDLCKFAMALLPDENGESVLFNKPETLAELFSPTLYYSDEETARFCHGFWVLSGCQGNVIGHAGNTTSCSSMLAIDPYAGVGAVLMTNQQQEGIYNYGLIYEIFGEKGLTVTENMTDEDISGIYFPSRSIFMGILKISGLFQATPVQKNDDNSLFNPLGGAAFEYVAPGVYRGTLGDMVIPAYAEFNQAGQVQKISMTPFDYIPTIWGLVIFDIATLVFFVIAGLYGLVALIVLLVNKIRKKPMLMGGLRTAICGSSLAALMNFVVLLSIAAVIVQGMLFILIGLVPAVCTLIMILRAKKLELPKKHKRQLVITSAMGLVTTFNILYWQLWMFWV